MPEFWHLIPPEVLDRLRRPGGDHGIQRCYCHGTRTQPCPLGRVVVCQVSATVICSIPRIFRPRRTPGCDGSSSARAFLPVKRQPRTPVQLPPATAATDQSSQAGTFPPPKIASNVRDSSQLAAPAAFPQFSLPNSMCRQYLDVRIYRLFVAAGPQCTNR